MAKLRSPARDKATAARAKVKKAAKVPKKASAKAPRKAAPKAVPAPKAASKTLAPKTSPHGVRSSARRAEVRYHHHALRDTLLVAAERILERDGLAGLTLVSDLAAIGFARFNAAMVAAAAGAATPLEQAAARARAYLAYARAHPAMYLLMFRTERLDLNRPALRDATNAAFAGLTGTIGDLRREAVDSQALSLDQAAGIVRAWSLVHGYTTLLLDGRLAEILQRLPPGVDAETLFGAVLTAPLRPPA